MEEFQALMEKIASKTDSAKKISLGKDFIKSVDSLENSEWDAISYNRDYVMRSSQKFGQFASLNSVLFQF
jgi:hypothetical protein